MKRIKHIHFVGIKGVGMTPLAILAKEAKIKITGSDLEERFITDEVLQRFTIEWKAGFSPKNIEGRPDLVVVTGAHGGLNNIEAQFAKEKGLSVVLQGEAVGIFMDGKIFGRDFEGISVSGSHGKTTTTAMLATVLERNHLDPSFIVGCGDISAIGSPGHFGKGRYFIAEADEYAISPQTNLTPKFLWQNPQIIVINNIEYDHPDVFENINDVKKAFADFIQKLPSDGLVIAGGDNRNVEGILKETNRRVITFGESPQNEWQISKFSMNHGRIKFLVSHKGRHLSEYQLLVPGRFNALNALATIIVGIEIGLTPEKIKEALAKFTGAKRRFEFIGEAGGAKLYDDYAHHPSEIAATLRAAKDFFPKQKIICIFQPHTYSRTKMLLNDFAHCFNDASEIVITDIYSSAREKEEFGINAKILADEISKNHPCVRYLGDEEKIVEYFGKENHLNDVIFTMGAGDIFLWHREILEALK